MPIGFLAVETVSRQLRANITRQAPLGAAQRKQTAMWIERRRFSVSKGLFVSDVIWRLMASSASTTRTFAASGNLMEPVESEPDEAQPRPAAVAKPDRLDDAPGHSGGGMSGWWSAYTPSVIGSLTRITARAHRVCRPPIACCGGM
jgi:hypothetical protein